MPLTFLSFWTELVFETPEPFRALRWTMQVGIKRTELWFICWNLIVHQVCASEGRLDNDDADMFVEQLGNR